MEPTTREPEPSARDASSPLEGMAALQGEALAAFDPLARVGFLATRSDDGRVRNRPLVLRRIARDGIEVTTSSTSPKWSELLTWSTWELVVYWPSLRRHYRVSGREVQALAPGRLNEIWSERGRASQLLEHAYQVIAPLSAPLADRAIFVEGMNRLALEQPPDVPLAAPTSFVGVRLAPTELEAWTESDAALHERTLWRRAPGSRPEDPGAWKATPLMP